MTRREALLLLAATAAPGKSSEGVSLGFSLYGMKGAPLAEAFRTCAKIGFDGVELCLLPGWTPPDNLDAAARRSVKEDLARENLGMLALMEQLSLSEREMPSDAAVERLKKAAGLGHAIAPGRPLVETVLGGKPGEWEASKNQFAERLAAWGETARSVDCTLCVKAHAGAAVDTPDKLLWIYRKAKSPNLKLTYDYSHFLVADLPLAQTLQAIISETRFIHVKDAKGTAAKPQFLLAGDGGVDYETYFRLLKTAGYHGPIVAEVSAQLQKLPGYDAVAAASHCYERLARAVASAGLRRLRVSGTPA